jgi:Rad3-related DNA helicase
MLRSAASTTFNTSKSGIPSTCNNEYSLSVWVQDRFLKLQQKIREGKGTSAINLEFERVGAIYYSLKDVETKHVFKITRQSVKTGHRVAQHLVIDAVICPEGLLSQVLRADKIILMSGSLTQDETALLAHGRSHQWITKPYLAPPANRPVHIWTVDQESRRDVKVLASKVRELYELHGRCPTLVHVTYGDSNAYRNELFDLDPLVNSQTNKFETEQEFRRKGGIWIASGCAEGIDLADDACRLLIIPSLLYQNMGDIHVQKRLGLPDGQRWYSLKTLESTIQRLGRGIRHGNDRCVSYILDPSFARLWGLYGSQFEKLNIVWGQTR